MLLVRAEVSAAVSTTARRPGSPRADGDGYVGFALVSSTVEVSTFFWRGRRHAVHGGRGGVDSALFRNIFVFRFLLTP